MRSFPRVAIKPGEVILPCYYNPVPSVNYIAEDAIRASHVIPNAYSNDTSTEYEISPTNWKLYAVLISTDSPEPRRSIFRRSNCSSVCVCVRERERERERERDEKRWWKFMHGRIGAWTMAWNPR